MKRFMNIPTLVVLACCLSLGNMAVIALSVLMPTALPVITAMSLGQSAGLASFAAYLLAISLDRSSADKASTPPEQRGDGS
jgi:hypothetical protein